MVSQRSRTTSLGHSGTAGERLHAMICRLTGGTLTAGQHPTHAMWRWLGINSNEASYMHRAYAASMHLNQAYAVTGCRPKASATPSQVSRLSASPGLRLTFFSARLAPRMCVAGIAKPCLSTLQYARVSIVPSAKPCTPITPIPHTIA
jgi:hypothetical protein